MCGCKNKNNDTSGSNKYSKITINKEETNTNETKPITIVKRVGLHRSKN